ncbi:MAG TPA: hypothetical protein VK711_16800 [Puia sp.]|jgi:hypothetical protein|nr:hypothetical protein [Puia sp.]
MTQNAYVEREKVTLASEFVKEFLPCIESAAELEGKMKIMSDKLMPLMDLFAEQVESNAEVFSQFANAYSDFVKDYLATNQLLYNFQQSIVNKTTALLGEYERAVKS